jgi:antitoxin ParD1/3/4
MYELIIGFKMSNIERLTIALPSEMALLVKSAVESGEYASVSEVLREALRAWKQKRLLVLAEEEAIKRGIATGLQELTDGKTKSAEEVFSKLEAKYKR